MEYCKIWLTDKGLKITRYLSGNSFLWYSTGLIGDSRIISDCRPPVLTAREMVPFTKDAILRLPIVKMQCTIIIYHSIVISLCCIPSRDDTWCQFSAASRVIWSQHGYGINLTELNSCLLQRHDFKLILRWSDV